MSAMTNPELQSFGQQVRQARLDRGLSKEEAARAAGISSITWKRIEDGHRVQDTKLRAVEKMLDLRQPGTAGEVRAGRQSLGMTHFQLAELLGVGARTLERWEQGDPIPPSVLERLRAVLAETPDDVLLAEVQRRFQAG